MNRSILKSISITTCNILIQRFGRFWKAFSLIRSWRRLVKNRLLYEMIDAICKIDLHTDAIDNHGMGYVFEELIRISNEQSNETAGEHFTPRDVIELMNAFIFATEKDELC